MIRLAFWRKPAPKVLMHRWTYRYKGHDIAVVAVNSNAALLVLRDETSVQCARNAQLIKVEAIA